MAWISTKQDSFLYKYRLRFVAGAPRERLRLLPKMAGRGMGGGMERGKDRGGGRTLFLFDHIIEEEQSLALGLRCSLLSKRIDCLWKSPDGESPLILNSGGGTTRGTYS